VAPVVYSEIAPALMKESRPLISAAARHGGLGRHLDKQRTYRRSDFPLPQEKIHPVIV
jgi:hypothetical protein